MLGTVPVPASPWEGGRRPSLPLPCPCIVSPARGAPSPLPSHPGHPPPQQWPQQAFGLHSGVFSPVIRTGETGRGHTAQPLPRASRRWDGQGARANSHTSWPVLGSEARAPGLSLLLLQAAGSSDSFPGAPVAPSPSLPSAGTVPPSWQAHRAASSQLSLHGLQGWARPCYPSHPTPQTTTHPRVQGPRPPPPSAALPAQN